MVRVHFFYFFDVKDAFELISHRRQALNQHTFLFPHILSTHTYHTKLEDFNKHEEMLIDIREKTDFADLKNSNTRNSLTSEFNVIE